MNPTHTWTVAEGLAGLQSQAIGLAEAAGLAAEARVLTPRGVWRHVPAAWWPAPLSAIEPAALAPPWPELVIGCGGKAAAVLAALRRKARTVIVQHPRMDIRRFDLVVAGRHDSLTGANVLVTRTAIHRVTPDRLAAAAAEWAPRLAHLPRPLVAVLVGGSNGRFRLDAPVGERLAAQLAEMMQRDRVGLAVTPSRRTDPQVRAALERTLRPLGAEVWDMTGDNPYFGMLALADAIVVTGDSVSMVSEAVATSAPVLLVPLPGRSHRIGLFMRGLIDDGRVRPYHGRLELWPTAPLDDTAAVAAEMCRRFGYRT
ncbi:mitochondrial fission ELM1 family protein [Limobrevibacterium gyesilva]|uniref:Mitochondrial fission ELM1 family protein n=1 Tax=Limobrevibacterium gyesilva TaxID=2991712 RepID=A0AA41YNG5_9PROT|nr:mitochondrial fission ELM1 family protein [Limobrevibacterium gyesilva]MCW3475935.1 mitochondrial fission ELM1 family protein [Limobrevibacterium gyesilva]